MSETITPSAAGVTRREFLNYAWLASLGILTVQIAGVSYLFTVPRFSKGEFGSEFEVGQVRAYPVGADPQLFPSGKFYLVRSQTGLLALYQVCTHLGCLVPWVASTGRFECPCHGSKFERDGTYIQGPAPRSLDRFVVRAVDARGKSVAETGPDGYPVPVPDEEAALVVDTGQRILGKPKGERYG